MHLLTNKGGDDTVPGKIIVQRQKIVPTEAGTIFFLLDSFHLAKKFDKIYFLC